MTHILVTRLDVHGDVLVGTSVLPGLREQYPDAEIDWHVRSGYGQLLEYNPYLRKVWQGPFDEIPEVYDKSYSLDHHYQWDRPMAQVYCDTCGVPLHRPEIYLNEAERKLAANNTGLILVANKAGWRSRECATLPDVLSELAANYPMMLQVDMGTPIRNIKRFDGTLRQVAALMSTASLYIGIDTVFMHMAVALNRPMVLCMGPTGPESQYIPGASFCRLFKHHNPAAPHEAFSYGVRIPREHILKTIRDRLDEYGTVDNSTETREIFL